MDFTAIIYDCDGVLVDSEALGLDVSVEYLQQHGFSWSAADLVRLFTGLRDDVFAEKLSARYREIHGTDPDHTFFKGLVDVRRAKRHLLKTVPGVERALSAIELPRAIASSSRTEFLEGKLKRTDLYGQFAPHIYSAERVAAGKPEPDIFLYAAQQLGVDPGGCLVIEDSVNGVLAGRAAGMTVWGFLGGGHCFEGHGARLTEAGAHAVMEDFDALTRALT